MSRNGSGTYSLPAGNPVVTGTTISSTWANNTLSDIATALTQSIASDGQTTPTANLKMGGFKLTGLGAGTVAGDAIRYEQLSAAVLPYAPAAGFLPHAAGTPNMTVILDAGNLQNGTAKASQSAQTTATFTAPTVNPRNDLIVVDQITGAYSVVAGAENASPVDPAIPYGKIAVARVRLTVGMSSITDASIDDLRPSYFISQSQDTSDNPWAYCGEALVDQVNGGSSYTITAGAAASYTIDGWLVSCTGANVTVQRGAGSEDFKNALQINGAASVTGVSAIARCESVNAARFVSAVSNLMVRMANSLSLPVTWTLAYANAADNFSAVTTISTGTVNPGTSLAKFDLPIASSANAGNGLQITLSIGALTSGTWVITGLDQILGSNTRNYPHISYDEVLKKCQYFLPVITMSSNGSIPGQGYQTSTTAGQVSLDFPTKARTPVTGVTFVGAVGGLNMNDPVSGTNPVTSATINYGGDRSAQLSVGNTVANWAQSRPMVPYLASTTKILFTGAQL